MIYVPLLDSSSLCPILRGPDIVKLNFQLVFYKGPVVRVVKSTERVPQFK